MVFGDHLLFDLQAQAAIASGWPTLHVFGDAEAEVLAAQDIVLQVLGPLPQADIIEPWDPEDSEDRWELRIDLPDLSEVAWASVREGLGAYPLVALVVGVAPGVRACEDRGYRYPERLLAGGLEAARWLTPDGLCALDVARAVGGDEALLILEAELAEAVRTISPDLVFRSDRGPDTTSTVVHRSTGRFGIRMHFEFDEPELRVPVLEAIAGVVRARTTHEVRLAPDLLWDTPLLGFEVGLWFVAPAVPGLPRDAPAAATTWSGDMADGVEVQVIPDDASAHDEVVAAVAAMSESRGLPLVGALPRWVRRQGAWHFCPVWTAPSAEGLEPLREIGATVRIVPGEPVGLGEAWLTSDVAWCPADFRCFVRIRDGLSDRDRSVEVHDRPRTPRDAEVEIQAFAALAVSEAAGLIPLGPGSPARAVVDGSGRPGLELAFDRRSFAEEALFATLRALGAIHGEDLASWALWSHRHDRTLVQLWYVGTYGEVSERRWQ